MLMQRKKLDSKLKPPPQMRLLPKLKLNKTQLRPKPQRRRLKLKESRLKLKPLLSKLRKKD